MANRKYYGESRPDAPQGDVYRQKEWRGSSYPPGWYESDRALHRRIIEERKAQKAAKKGVRHG